MKRFSYSLLAALIVLLGTYGSAQAVSVFITSQGGTGTTTPSGILSGDNGATTHLNTVIIGTGLTYSGNTLSANGSGTVTSVTATYPIISSGGTTPNISTAFGTTTPNVFSAPQTFNAGATTTSLSIGSLSGFLKASAGVVSTSLINLASDVSGVLPIGNGGTNASSQVTNGINYFDGTSITSSSSLQFTSSANPLLGVGTTTPTQALSVQGNGLFSGDVFLANLTATGTATVGNVINNGITANTLLYANGSKQESSVTIGTGISFSGGTLSASGGTGTVGTSSSETANQFPFWTTTNGTPALLSGTSNLFNSSGNIGVGTSSPLARFAIGMASTTPTFIAGVAGSSSPAFYIGTANQNGFVGYGTNVPDSPVTINMNTSGAPPALGVFTGTTLHTIGTDGLANRVVQDSFGGATVYSLRRADGTNASPTAVGANENVFTFGGAVYTGSGYTSTKAQFNMVTTQVQTPTANGMGFNFLTTPNNSTTLAEAMRIDSSGYIGIGTTTPAWKLDVASSSASVNTGVGFGQLALTDSGAGANLKHWLFSSENGNLYVGTTTDLYATSTVPAITIANLGNIGIGSSSPYAQLSLNAPAGTAPYFVIGSSTEVFKVTPSANGQLGIGTSTPTAAFVSVAASTTAGTVETGYNGVVAIIAGFENTTLKLFQVIDQWGHMITSGDTPAIAGGTSSVAGNDRNGTITVTGTLLTSVTLTFAHAWLTAPDCTIADSSTGITAGVTSISASQLVIGFSAGVNSGTVWYICQGHG